MLNRKIVLILFFILLCFVTAFNSYALPHLKKIQGVVISNITGCNSDLICFLVVQQGKEIFEVIYDEWGTFSKCHLLDAKYQKIKAGTVIEATGPYIFDYSHVFREPKLENPKKIGIIRSCDPIEGSLKILSEP